MTFFDLIKSLIDASKERIKTPISGAFICSFTIYNWRPIVELLFSKVSIEDRIYIIDQEYCNVWAIIIPILIALVYTIGVPMLMVKIDKILTETKRARIAKIYADKGDIMEGKITIAGKEFRLKNTESGNKEIQDLLDQIKALKETNNLLVIDNKNTSKQLNNTLSDVNNLKAQFSLTENEYKILLENKEIENIQNSTVPPTILLKEGVRLINKLSDDYAKKFKDLKEEKEGGRLVFRLTSDRKNSLEKFMELKLVHKIDVNDYVFTDLGSVVYNLLHLDTTK